MRRNVRPERPDDRQVIHVFAQLRKHLADLDARLPLLLKLERRRHRHSAHAGQRLPVVFGQLRFRVKCVDVRRRSLRKNVDHMLRLRRQRRSLGQ